MNLAYRLGLFRFFPALPPGLRPVHGRLLWLTLHSPAPSHTAAPRHAFTGAEISATAVAERYLRGQYRLKRSSLSRRSRQQRLRPPRPRFLLVLVRGPIPSRFHLVPRSEGLSVIEVECLSQYVGRRIVVMQHKARPSARAAYRSGARRVQVRLVAGSLRHDII